MKAPISKFTAIASLASLIGLSACAALPTTGPSAGAIAQEAAHHVRLMIVSPEDARVINAKYQSVVASSTRATINDLQMDKAPVSVHMLPGDVVRLTLWTQPTLAGLSSSTNAQNSVLQKADLGDYTIDESGNLILPYAGKVPVRGLGTSQAEQRISARFSALGQFEQAQVSMSVLKNRRQHVVVTGAANHPMIVNWQTGGLTLSDAITRAGGYKIFTSSKTDMSTNQVVIQRGVQHFSLPMATAIEADVPLYPGDVVVLEHKTMVRVECLGGGWSKDTLQAFNRTPTLSQVVASGGGLSASTAQGKTVYVLSASRHTVYEFRWDQLAGLRAAQIFPIESGDIVYIATSPSVQLQQVVNILFDVAYPVAAAHNL